MKRIITPIVILALIAIIVVAPLVSNKFTANKITDMGYYESRFNSYIKNVDDEVLLNFQLPYTILGTLTLSYSKASIDADYNGKTIEYSRSACIMKKVDDEFVLVEDAPTKCMLEQPDEEIINLLIEEYEKI